MSPSAFIRKNFRRAVLASVGVLGAFRASRGLETNGSATLADTVFQAFSITNRISNLDDSKIFKIPPYYRRFFHYQTILYGLSSY